ncbi:MAG: hypothetical protein KDD11_05445 [Acidobacteria bacterium]|nr:hypothetical protein [Acidobacteriota bacterium]
MRLLSYSLWGNDAKYGVGALRNVDLAAEHYPGWRCRFYLARSVGADLRRRLAAAPNAELVAVAAAGDWRSLLWRLHAAADPRVEVVVFRDTDSRPDGRERAAVEEWLGSGLPIHVMRDHPWHRRPIHGGMWGLRRGALPELPALLAAWPAADRWGDDEDFLARQVYPRVADRCLVHDEIGDGRPFPVPRRPRHHVGMVLDEHERPVADHLEALDRALAVSAVPSGKGVPA